MGFKRRTKSRTGPWRSGVATMIIPGVRIDVDDEFDTVVQTDFGDELRLRKDWHRFIERELDPGERANVRVWADQASHETLRRAVVAMALTGAKHEREALGYFKRAVTELLKEKAPTVVVSEMLMYWTEGYERFRGAVWPPALADYVLASADVSREDIREAKLRSDELKVVEDDAVRKLHERARRNVRIFLNAKRKAKQEGRTR